MKKLIAFAAVAALAVAAQAATVNWTSGTMYIAKDASGAWADASSANRAKQSVTATYLIVDASTYNTYKDGGQALYDAFKAGNVSYSYKSDAITSNNGGAALFNDSTHDYAAGTTVYALAVYEYTHDTYGKFYIATSGAAYISGSGPSSVDGTNGYQNLASSVGSWSPVTVPEPTTVALLALGLAAVGLKRKVA